MFHFSIVFFLFLFVIVCLFVFDSNNEIKKVPSNFLMLGIDSTGDGAASEHRHGLATSYALHDDR